MKKRVVTALGIILVVALPLAFGGWLLELVRMNGPIFVRTLKSGPKPLCQLWY